MSEYAKLAAIPILYAAVIFGQPLVYTWIALVIALAWLYFAKRPTPQHPGEAR